MPYWELVWGKESWLVSLRPVWVMPLSARSIRWGLCDTVGCTAVPLIISAGVMNVEEARLIFADLYSTYR